MMGAIAVTTITIVPPAQAKPDDALPVLSNLQEQYWNPQSLITTSLLTASSYFILHKSKKRDLMASARWAKNLEKMAAHKVAIKQINERKPDGLTTKNQTPSSRKLATNY